MTTMANKGEILMVNDISRAFFHAKVKRGVYVQLAEEDKGPNEHNMCGKLNYSMDGTRDAAQNSFEEYSGQFRRIGFKQGKASPCVFYNPDRCIRTMVHGDDYVSAGMEKDSNWMRQCLEQKYQVKTQTLGPSKEHMKQIKVLNRVITWACGKGLIYEVDPRHVEIILQQLDSEQAKAVATPGTKDEGRTKAAMEDHLPTGEASKYRALVARCIYLAPDRPDIAFSVKEFARRMSAPTMGDWIRLKRLGRYLKGRPRLQLTYGWQDAPKAVKTYSDADWAGCEESGKSTTGGCIILGTHLIKGWSKTQSLIALSSAESESYVILKASAETFGVLSMLKDLGYILKGEVWGDASVALGIINRNGLGKTRHIDTSLLWVQETAAQQRLRYSKVLGRDGPADLYTKYRDTTTMDHHTERMKCQYCEGRADEAPKLHLLSKSLEEYLSGNNHEDWEWLQAGSQRERVSSNIKGGHLGLVIKRRISKRTCTKEEWRRTGVDHHYCDDIATQKSNEGMGHSCYSRLHCEAPARGALLRVQVWGAW